jgi:hypothetical protein
LAIKVRKFNKFLGLFFILLFQVCFGQDYSDEIIFYSNGSTFSPLISIQGDATIIWTFADSTTSSSLNPTKDYGSELQRKNRLKVLPWSALKAINIGYDGSDGGSDSIPLLPSQKVSKVEHLRLVAPYLELWCSSYNLLDSLNFNDFINLATIECYKCVNLQFASFKNMPSLKRLCLEDNGLRDTLDISECASLEDLRVAINNFKDVKFSNSTEEIWHLCVRDNPKIENSSLFSHLENFPSLSVIYIWNSNQSGTFKLKKTITDEIFITAHDNSYSILDLSGALQKLTSWARVDFENNQLESVNVSGCKQIYKLNLRNNKLAPDSVDKVLRQVDEFGDVKYTDYRFVDLRDNSLPTNIGLVHKANLEARGWTVYVQTGCEINVSGSSVNISNGDNTPSKNDLTDFDSVEIASEGKTNTFIIKNTGTTPLELYGDSTFISITGTNASDFMIITEPDSIISVGDSTSFQIAFKPSENGLMTATVSISNNDWDNDPFNFNIQGTGVALTDLESNLYIPTNFELSQNYPNPFNPFTVINYQLPTTCFVTLKIYDIMGKEVAIIVKEEKATGNYSVRFDASGLSSGLYFYKIMAGSFSQSRKMVLIK